MNWEELAASYLDSNSDPSAAWKAALRDRYSDSPYPQQLANAEHYLWANQFGQQSPLHGMVGMVMPFGYSLAKNLGLLGGRSEADLEQLKAGTLGAGRGLLNSFRMFE